MDHSSDSGSTNGPKPSTDTGVPLGPFSPAPHHKSFWLWVMCLTGVDYFSTLGYQPSIAFDSAGMLAPLATVVLVLVTLFGALPVYAYVAKHSPHGQGSIAMLEKLVSGWAGKTLVLVLLGFAATDFVITKTLSAADAAEHLIRNPLWKPLAPSTLAGEDRQRMIVTMFLLVVLGATFFRGFKEVIGIAVVIVGVYLTLNAVVVAYGLTFILENRHLLTEWWQRVEAGQWYLADPPLRGTGGLTVLLLALLLFPKLALGLSGFETGVAVMPLIRGDPDDTEANPVGRIRNTRKLLVSAAVIMSVFLLTSSVAVSALIPPEALVTVNAAGEARRDSDGRVIPERELPKPPARDRALAYLAHGEGNAPISPLFGPGFGTVYDISTIVILWFAGASAMAGLLNLVPQYLPRYGMAPNWTRATRPLVVLFTAINLLVTWIFNADVTAQGGAYATGVLVLITSACVATVIGRYRERVGRGSWVRRVPWVFTFITGVFFYTTALNIWEKPEGIKIAACFIAAIIVSSMMSRVARARELRFAGFQYADEQSRFLWESIKALDLPVLVPHRPGKRSLATKEATIRREHRLPDEMYVLFIEVEVKDPSEFYQQPLMSVIEEEGRYVLRITRAASIPHTLAAVALELAKVGRPPEIHFGWTDESPVAGALGFLFLGEGNVPWMVHELIRRAQPDKSKQPAVIVGGV
jgi:hypothetical protein